MTKMPSSPVHHPSNHLVINTHNLSQAHNRGSPRSANANSAMTFKDSNRPPAEKRQSLGPSSLGPGAGGNSSGNSGGGNGHFHGHGLGHGRSRSRQSLALTALRIIAGAPGFLGVIYSLSTAWDKSFFDEQQQRHQHQEGSYQSISDEVLLTRSDFWMASMWCGLSMYWAFLLTTALIQRLLQSYRPPNVVLRIALAHIVSWILIGTIIASRPVSEPTRPWIFITFGQGLLLFATVYLPWFKSQLQSAGYPKISEKLTSHTLEDGFMGRDITGHSATRFLLLPLVVLGLCSWMLIITRGTLESGQVSGNIQNPRQSSLGLSPNNIAGSFLDEVDRQHDGRMVISMLVLSSSTPQGYLNRQLFRNTTLKLFPTPRNKAVIVKYRFIIGNAMPAVERELEQEYRLMGDLLIVSVPDKPDTKSRKLYKAIEWADQFDFDYLVMTEDDVLVRMDMLSGELYKQGKKPYFWKGLVFKNVPNMRLDDMDLKEMPLFTDGTLTTLSRDIVRLLAVPAPRYFVASSAQSLGIWLHGYGIRPEHDVRIQPGAFVCEEDMMAKHFDNEPSLALQPRDDPIKMVERINRIRSELKQNKNNRGFQTSISICDTRIKKRCAICYSCQGRTSNWKLMGFDCKQGGVVVGDKYRKPDLLDAKQMDELLNRPPTGVSDELGPVFLKDYGLGSGVGQPMQSSDNESSQPVNDFDSQADLDENQEDVDPEQEGELEDGTSGDNENEPVDQEGAENLDDETSDAQDEEETEVQENEEEAEVQEDEEETEEQEEEGEDESDHEHHDESEIAISDQEVDYLDRRHDEDAALPIVESSQKRKQKPAKAK